MEERSEAEESGAHSPLGGCDAGRVLNTENKPKERWQAQRRKDAGGMMKPLGKACFVFPIPWLIMHKISPITYIVLKIRQGPTLH